MILKSILNDNINIQQNFFYNKKLEINRELFSIIKEEKAELIIINGIKRVGKTSFLFQLYEQLYYNAFYLNFSHPTLYSFDYNDLFKLDEIIEQSGTSVLFFDEIETFSGWESYVKQKLDEGYKVVLAASNTQILNNDLGFNLVGRSVVKNLLPFSFNEFCSFNKLEKNEEATLNYIRKGGFPANQNVPSTEYLSQLFDDIVVRDIALRFGVRDMKLFKRLAMHLLINTGKYITGNQLKHTLGIKTTATAIDYLFYLEAGFLMFYLPKFSYSARKQLINPRKVYTIDTGFIVANVFSWEKKIEQLLENLVFLKLRKNDKELYYFTEQYHCDFIVFGKEKAQKAVQVCHSLQQDNLEKELKGLFEAMDFFDFKEGTLVTMNQTDRFERNGKIVEVLPFHLFHDEIRIAKDTITAEASVDLE